MQPKLWCIIILIYLLGNGHYRGREKLWSLSQKKKKHVKVLNTMWFANKQDDGVTYPEYFKPMTDITVVLVLAVA